MKTTLSKLLFSIGVVTGIIGLLNYEFRQAQSADLQLVNIGSPNEGTGDTLRDAFIKVNTNFWDVWATRVISVNSNTGTNITVDASEVPATAPSLLSGTNVQQLLDSINSSLTLTGNRIAITDSSGVLTTTNDLTFDGSLFSVLSRASIGQEVSSLGDASITLNNSSGLTSADYQGGAGLYQGTLAYNNLANPIDGPFTGLYAFSKTSPGFTSGGNDFYGIQNVQSIGVGIITNLFGYYSAPFVVNGSPEPVKNYSHVYLADVGETGGPNTVENLTGIRIASFDAGSASNKAIVVEGNNPVELGGSLTVSGATTLSTLGLGATDTVVTHSSNTLQTRTINSDVWNTGANFLEAANNLSDVGSASTARSNLGLGTAATQNSTAFLQTGNNLSDLGSASTARSNLGLGSAATQSTTAFLQPANNLSDILDAATARSNLGIGAIGSPGDYLQVTNNLSDLSSVATARTNLGLGTAATQNTSAFLQPANNLSDVSSASTARANLSVFSFNESSSRFGRRVFGPDLSFDGINDYIEVADSDKLSFSNGTDDLAFSITIAGETESSASNFTFVSKFGTTSTSREYRLYKDTANKLVFQIYDNTGSNGNWKFTSDSEIPLSEFFHAAVTYSGAGPNSSNAFSAASASVAMYVNAKSVSFSSVQSATYAGLGNTSESMKIGRGNGSDYLKGFLTDVRIHAHALSLAEVKEDMRGTILLKNQWAGVYGGNYSSTFSAGVDGWSGTGGTLTGNIDAISGQDDNLRIVPDTSTGTHRAFKVAILPAGKYVRMDFDYFIPSANSNVDGFRVDLGSGGATQTVTTATFDAWKRFSFSGVVNASNTSLYIYLADGGSITFTDAGGDDLFYVRNIKSTEIGILADFRAGNFVNGNWLDRSTNDFVGVNNGSTLSGQSKGLHISTDSLAGTTDIINIESSVEDVFTVTADGSLSTEGNVTINSQSDLRLADADSSNYIGFQAPATVSTNVVFTFPSSDGSANQVLKTNGSGTLSWTDASITYATGTWTPGVSFGSGTTGITYTAQEGYYVRINDQVTLHYYVELSSKGSAVGEARLTGFPFAAKNTSNRVSAAAVWIIGHTSIPNGAMLLRVLPNTTVAGVYDGHQQASDANFTNTTIMSGTITYLLP